MERGRGRNGRSGGSMAVEYLHAALVAFVVLTAFLVQASYLLRFLCSFILGLLSSYKGRRNFLDTFACYGICTTNDLDFMFHMNNTRYLREMDFNRIWFWGSSGLIQEVRRLRGMVLQSGCSIRYRKPITFLQVFKVECKVLYWDERNMYLEQRVVTLRDGFVRAIALTKQTAVGITMPEIVRAATGMDLHSPLPPPELVKWIESNEISSLNLRRQEPSFKKDLPVYPYTGADQIFGPISSEPCACSQDIVCCCHVNTDKTK